MGDNYFTLDDTGTTLMLAEKNLHIWASATVGGGNLIVGNAHDATHCSNCIVAGFHNHAEGVANVVYGNQNSVSGDFNTCVGGQNNTVGGTACSIGGGLSNLVQSVGAHISGGMQNSLT
jgi:hypothetical protein